MSLRYITVVGAKRLKLKSTEKLYVRVEFGKQTFKTSAAKVVSGKDHTWDATFQVKPERANCIEFQLMDKDTFSKDDVVGEGLVKVASRPSEGEVQHTLTLWSNKGEKVGELDVAVEYNESRSDSPRDKSSDSSDYRINYRNRNDSYKQGGKYRDRRGSNNYRHSKGNNNNIRTSKSRGGRGGDNPSPATRDNNDDPCSYCIYCQEERLQVNKWYEEQRKALDKQADEERKRIGTRSIHCSDHHQRSTNYSTSSYRQQYF